MAGKEKEKMVQIGYQGTAEGLHRLCETATRMFHLFLRLERLESSSTANKCYHSERDVMVPPSFRRERQPTRYRGRAADGPPGQGMLAGSVIGSLKIQGGQELALIS